MTIKKPQTVRLTQTEINLAVQLLERRIDQETSTVTGTIHEALRAGLLMMFAFHRDVGSGGDDGYTDQQIATLLRPYAAMINDYLAEHGAGPPLPGAAGNAPNQIPSSPPPALPGPGDEQGYVGSGQGVFQFDASALEDLSGLGE